MIFDIASVNNILEFAGGILAGAVGFWKFVVKPWHEFKDKTNLNLHDLTKDFESLTQKFAAMEKQMQDLSDDVSIEVDDIRKEHQALIRDTNNHIVKIDNKSDKLLDLILKYFRDR